MRRPGHWARGGGRGGGGVGAARLRVGRLAGEGGGGPPADGPREGREDGDGDGDDCRGRGRGRGVHRWVGPLSRCAYAGGRRAQPLGSVCRWAGERGARGTIVSPPPPVWRSAARLAVRWGSASRCAPTNGCGG